jgi:2-polyprenyl-3-methyl-5-hydroxy-6-metoxy-1,4-benzoquinol methylase
MTTPLKDKYELEVIPIAIGGKKLDLFGLANWDVFIKNLEEQGEKYIRKFPFWVKIWEASLVLADHLIRIGLGKEKDILEIGAGMGVTGLFLGAFGYKITVTEYEEDALELLRMNVEHNGLDTVTVKKLDWNDPHLTETYDVICGSELIFNVTFIEPIIKLFRKYLRPEGTVFLAHDVRRRCMLQFIEMIHGKYEIENVPKTMKRDDEVHKVFIHALRLK